MRYLTGAIALGLAAVFYCVALSHRANAHDGYEGWHPPNTPHTSCCNGADCRATRAYKGDDGDWFAWDGRGWLRIPYARYLGHDFAHDGRNHLCEKDGTVYCFTDGDVKS